MHMLEQHMGQDHVSAQDQADENMAQFGSGTYLTKYKDAYPTVEMTSANQLTIGTGSILVNGRHCIIDTPEVLTVDNGSSGMTERDLVCVHWKEVEAEVQAASGDDTQTITKEEVDLVIVKGTPASSGATDPEISQDTIRSGVGEAWVPFARITKDGLTPSVAFTVDKMAPESEFRDSISRSVRIWSGAWVMATNHTARFSETIENFKTLYFVWSSYTGGQIRDYNYNITAVPVAFVLNHLSVSTIHTVRDSADVNATKVLYVSKTYATGNAVNDQGDSKSFVLREVYGVA